MFDETFSSNVEIKEETTNNRDDPFFMGIKKDPITLKLTFAFEDGWDDLLILDVERWLLNHDYYQPLVFYDANDRATKIYHVICVDEARLIHNGLRQGYITLSFRSKSPYAFLPVGTEKVYDWTYTSKSITQPDLSTGKNDKTEVNNNQVRLIANKPRWIDDSPEATWADD